LSAVIYMIIRLRREI